MAKAHSDHESTRRDFLFIATGATGAVIAGSAVWPLIDQMNPDASVLALASIDVDVSGVEEGQQITVMWRGKPVFIRKRTADEIATARDVSIDLLPDGNARNANDPDAKADDADRSFGENGEWMVMVGVCTHLGCVPIGDGAGDFGGWYCPCHGSHYDTAGRIRKGPAPQNLPIPEIAFDGDVISILNEYKA
ncbi:MAG: ubiquinol-cytochrome c reductase iron-sulfur subunit [Rhodobacteraceae bacterium]|nr:ubiquinol-cytochrome c reductase iron-sulfur subunit [Paracoccaceae bacterium]